MIKFLRFNTTLIENLLQLIFKSLKILVRKKFLNKLENDKSEIMKLIGRKRKC